MEKVLFSNQEFLEALEELNKHMREAEKMTDANHKVLLYNVLQYFDAINREPIARIMQTLRSHPELRSQVLSDPTVKKLCDLYEIEDSPVDNQSTLAFIPESEVGILTPYRKKDWLELGNIEDLEQGRLYAKNYEQVNFLISKIQQDVYAVQNQCDGSILPIDTGTLEEHYLICPWHGCKYDLKTGKSIDLDKQLQTYQVEVADDGILKVEIAY